MIQIASELLNLQPFYREVGGLPYCCGQWWDTLLLRGPMLTYVQLYWIRLCRHEFT